MTGIVGREAALRRRAADVRSRLAFASVATAGYYCRLCRAASAPVLQTRVKRMDPVCHTLVGAALAKARFCLGVQWHPEHLAGRRGVLGLFRGLVEAARR